MLQDLYIGADVGSTAVRVGLMDATGALIVSTTRPIDHKVSSIDHRFVTQSSEQILTALKKCIDELTLPQGVRSCVKGLAIVATCSVVVTRRSGDNLNPYPADYGFQNADQNVIFWMDTRPHKETKEMNQVLSGHRALGYMGGCFVEEMALPKVKYIVDNAPADDVADLVFFDLHDYLSFMFAETGIDIIELSNTSNPVAIDGEVKGWSAELLDRIGLSQLSKNNFAGIGCLERHKSSILSPIPYAGRPIGYTCEGIPICQGVIDSYGGWLGSCGREVEGTLTMVAGTSTCFIVGHKIPKPVKGIWGPFNGFFPDLLVTEGGQATTGKLIEHLFETHPAYPELKTLGPNVFTSLESLITRLEEESSCNIHVLSRHMFLFGELSGNRTPYADASMRGAFFGESTDITIKDLVLKYVCILECLAFQTKQVLSVLDGYGIAKIRICGSQAKNSRLVTLLSRVTGLPVEVSNSNPDLSGVKGSAYLAYSGANNVPLVEVLKMFNDETTVCYGDGIDDPKLTALLNTKYEIMLDIAERQLKYKKMIDSCHCT
ncbi:Protein MPA43 [Cyberlindnera fabianii]|uniref:Protein MPA43 n=1 Tax=Cyberlindnera fabianii TaxID=36022 RepID=A0A1V2L6I7_CYBFA|nr:Protein MPA43 [Cyberlindnera fabianii]